MIRPFIPEDLFKLNKDIDPVFDGEVVYIDNIFQNYDEIMNILNNYPVQIWKHTPTSRNFKEYYDCRLLINNFFPDKVKISERLNTILNIIKYYFKIKGKYHTKEHFEFNVFKHIDNNYQNNFQMFPHIDEGSYNVLTYLDPYENGGTALYEKRKDINIEQENLFEDISNYKIKKIIESKPNRCVIFSGDQPHGGYIEDHEVYRSNWRINMIQFIDKINE